MSADGSVMSESRSAPWFGFMLGAVACVVLFGPLVAITSYYALPTQLPLDTAAETVGIGVILRAILRRLFRSGARSAMQATMGTVARASARTVTRRVVRVGVKSLATLFRRRLQSLGKAPTEATVDVTAARQSTPLAVGLGFVALALSLAGVLLVVDVQSPAAANEAGQAGAILGGMTFLVAALLGAVPLIVYAALLLAAAPYCGATVRFRTGWEALLLQAYFTGSGSYLPLSTDSEIEGPQSASTRLALAGLGSLLALHVVCAAAAHYFNLYPLEYLAGMFLLYCFVFSFPIPPLDGYHLWRTSRWLWLAAWIPILAAFIFTMPASLHAIL